MELYNTLSAKQRAVLIEKAGGKRLTLSFYIYHEIKNISCYKSFKNILAIELVEIIIPFSSKHIYIPTIDTVRFPDRKISSNSNILTNLSINNEININKYYLIFINNIWTTQKKSNQRMIN